jgi:hypothetical protein
MDRGRYAGAAFEKPVALKLQGGLIQPGLWSHYALPTYSGIGIYKQSLSLSAGQAQQEIELDLGEVYVAAEVNVNGKSAGVKVAKPFKFNLTGLFEPGENELEIRVANTLAPHYTIPKTSIDIGPVKSGLVGPVTIKARVK